MPIRWTAVLAALALAGPAAAEPALTFTSHSVAASGLTPHGQIVWFGVVHDFAGWIPRVTHVRSAAEANDDGRAELASPVPGPAAAVWTVVDIASGGFAAGRPEDPAVVVDLPTAAWQVGGDGIGADRLVVGRTQLDLVLVRPGAGAWGTSAGDGGVADADEASDGTLTAALDHLEPLGATSVPTPHQGQPADRLVAIDPETLEVLTLVLP